MYIKIYFNNKPLFLCDNVDETIQPYIHHDDAVFIDELNTHTIKSMIHEMEQEKVHAGVFFHPDLEELKKAFYKKFTIIIAAGGLVQNEKKRNITHLPERKMGFAKRQIRCRGKPGNMCCPGSNRRNRITAYKIDFASHHYISHLS